MAKATSEPIIIEDIRMTYIKVPVVGTAPLIISNFSKKIQDEMLESQQGKKKQKTKRDPKAEYKDRLYLFADGRYGFPSVGFKAATCDAFRIYKAAKKTELRQFLFFEGEIGIDGKKLTEIIGEPEMRQDAVRLSGPGRSADLRFRPAFNEWKAVLDISFVADSISLESVLALINCGGKTVGVGEWRQQHNGDFGTYEISGEVITYDK